MQRLASDYTHHVNRRHLRDGALFRGRFKSVEIETDAQLLQTLRYIHLNPVKSGSSARPENWHWSSAAAYLQIASKPPWLTTQLIMDMFGGASIDAYRDFMSLGVDELTTERYLRLGW